MAQMLEQEDPSRHAVLRDEVERLKFNCTYWRNLAKRCEQKVVLSHAEAFDPDIFRAVRIIYIAVVVFLLVGVWCVVSVMRGGV